MTENTKSLAGKKILWVEDDNFLTNLVAKKLSTEQCVLLHASNGDQTLKLLETETPDIIVLDILLPGMDGFEILKKIRASDKTKSTPVILLSNLGQKNDLEKGKELGASKFLIKATVNLDEIVSEIRAFVA